MCFIAIALRSHPKFPFVVAANRDELHNRAADPLHLWPTAVPFAAGTDRTAGGTWLGLSTHGHFAALTNCRGDGRSSKPGLRSRGTLVKDYLLQDSGLLASLEDGALVKDPDFGGFNLVVGTAQRLQLLSNIGPNVGPFESGIRVISNHPLSLSWPKTLVGKRRFTDILDMQAGSEKLTRCLFDFLQEKNPVTNNPDLESRDDLASQIQRTIFVTGETYGTRASTVILLDTHGRASITEKTFAPGGVLVSTQTVRFKLEKGN
ncbi:MAG: NRDE family protein [Arenicellales bacterium]